MCDFGFMKKPNRVYYGHEVNLYFYYIYMRPFFVNYLLERLSHGLHDISNKNYIKMQFNRKNHANIDMGWSES